MEMTNGNTQPTARASTPVSTMNRGESEMMENVTVPERERDTSQNEHVSAKNNGQTPDHKIVRDMEGMNIHSIMVKLSQSGFRDGSTHSWNEDQVNSVIDGQYDENERISDDSAETNNITNFTEYKDKKEQEAKPENVTSLSEDKNKKDPNATVSQDKDQTSEKENKTETPEQKRIRILDSLASDDWDDWHDREEDIQLESIDERAKREAFEKHYTLKVEKTVGEGIPGDVKKDKVFQQMYGKLAMEAALKGENVDSDKVMKMALADYYKAQDMSRMLSGLGIPEDMSPEQRAMMFELLQNYLAKKRKRLEDDEDDDESMNIVDIALQFATLLIGEIAVNDDRARKDMIAASKPGKARSNKMNDLLKAVA